MSAASALCIALPFKLHFYGVSCNPGGSWTPYVVKDNFELLTLLLLTLQVCASILFWFCQFDTTKGYLGRGSSIKKMPPSYWLEGKPLLVVLVMVFIP